MAYNPSPLDTSPTSTQTIKQGGDAINANFTEIPNMIASKEKRTITTTDPTVNDDSSQGYSVWSLWANTTTSEVYRCIDVTVGAAVWVKTTLTIDELGSAAVQNDDRYAHRANNLSDIANPTTARTNLGLGTAAVQSDDRYTHNDIVNDSVVGVGLYAGSQRLEWTKAFAATTGALVFEITGVYDVTSMVGKMTVTISEANKPDRVFFIEGRWNGGINNWDGARCIELTEGSTELLPIRFSVDTVNQKTFIIIGNVGSTWNNLRIKIDDVLTNWNDTLNLGFVITETIDFTGLTHTFEFNPTRYEVAVKTNVTTTAPTVNDDNTLGYVVWSRWLDTVSGNIYICIDTTTGAAVWEKTTLTIDELGGAALENVGTDIGDVLQLEDVGGVAGLPAVDGSQLTGVTTDSSATIATITPATDADVTLTEAQYTADVLVIETGAWTTARNIIVPNEERSWQVLSNSAHLATIKTAAGTGVEVPAGRSAIVLCDGTNVVSAIEDADSEATAGKLALRDANGTFKVGTATDPEHPVRLGDIKQDSDITVTVGAGADFETINEALTHLSNFYPEYKNAGVTATIELQAGFVMSEQVLVRGIDFGWVTITGVDTQTTINNSALTIDFTSADYEIESYPAFGVSKGGTLPRIGQLFIFDVAGVGGNKHGVMTVGAGSGADVLADCGVVNAGSRGIFAISGSTISADGANASDAGDFGIIATRGSTINAQHANATGAGNIGIFSFSGSRIDARVANATGAVNNDIEVGIGSTINAVGATGNTNIAVNTLTSSGIIFG